MLGNLVILSGFFLTFFREAGNSVMFTYLTPYMQSILHMQPSHIGIVVLVFGVFGVIGSRLGGYMVDRWGNVRLIIGGIAVHAVSLSLLPLFSSLFSAGFALIAIMVFSMFITGPAIQTYFIQQAPESSNLVLSLNTSIIHLGLAAGVASIRIGGTVLARKPA